MCFFFLLFFSVRVVRYIRGKAIRERWLMLLHEPYISEKAEVYTDVTQPEYLKSSTIQVKLWGPTLGIVRKSKACRGKPTLRRQETAARVGLTLSLLLLIMGFCVVSTVAAKKRWSINRGGGHCGPRADEWRRYCKKYAAQLQLFQIE